MFQTSSMEALVAAMNIKICLLPREITNPHSLGLSSMSSNGSPTSILSSYAPFSLPDIELETHCSAPIASAPALSYASFPLAKSWILGRETQLVSKNLFLGNRHPHPPKHLCLSILWESRPRHNMEPIKPNAIHQQFPLETLWITCSASLTSMLGPKDSEQRNKQECSYPIQ